MYFPEQFNTTPDDCVGQESQIIDFVEKHFVIDDIDKIRFQNETYHIKQFLPEIVSTSIYGDNLRLYNYGILTGLSKKLQKHDGQSSGLLELLYGEYVNGKDIVLSGSDKYRETSKCYLFEPKTHNLFLKQLFKNEFNIYVQVIILRPNDIDIYKTRISYIRTLSEQVRCEPKPKDLNYIALNVYPQLENGQSYGEIDFTTETLIPVCKYLIAINLFHNASKYYSFKHKVETRKLLKGQQLQIDDLREKINLQDYVQVEILKHQEKQDGYMKHFGQRLINIEQQSEKYVNEELQKYVNEELKKTAYLN